MDARPESITAPNGVELLNHPFANGIVRAEAAAGYAIEGDGSREPVEVLLEQGAVWVSTRLGGWGAVISSGSARVEVDDGSVVVDAGFSGEGLVLVIVGHADIVEASGATRTLRAGEVGVLDPDGSIAAVDEVGDEELGGDPWVVANIGLDADAAAEQTRLAAAAVAAAASAGVAADRSAQGADGPDGDAETEGDVEPEAEIDADPDLEPEIGPEIEPEPEPEADGADAEVADAVDEEVWIEDAAGVEDDPWAGSEPALISASGDDAEAEVWLEDETTSDREPDDVVAPIIIGDRGEPIDDLPYSGDSEDDGEEPPRRRRFLRLLEVVVLVVVVAVGALVIALYNRDQRQDAGPVSIDSPVSLVPQSSTTRVRPATTAAPASTGPSASSAPSSSEAVTTIAPSTTAGAGSTTVPTTVPDEKIDTALRTCTARSATLLVASGTASGSTKTGGTYEITVGVTTSDQAVLGQTTVTAPIAADGSKVPWQAEITVSGDLSGAACEVLSVRVL